MKELASDSLSWEKDSEIASSDPVNNIKTPLNMLLLKLGTQCLGHSI
jgi:hypothetical protein